MQDYFLSFLISLVLWCNQIIIDYVSKSVCSSCAANELHFSKWVFVLWGV